MKEEFLVYLWKHRLIRGKPLKTVCGDILEVLSPGRENINSGPDFLAAMVRIGNTLWAGNVELHIRSSQWYTHGHHHDSAYANIILHVAMVVDKEIFDQHGNPVHQLEARGYYETALESKYLLLLQSRRWIACEKMIRDIDDYFVTHWLWRLFIIRLERKAEEVLHYRHYFEQHQEMTLLFMLGRNLGGKANASAFGLLIQRVSYNILLKNHDNAFALEALLLGQAGLLEQNFTEEYPLKLQREYAYLRHKYGLPPPLRRELWKYARMRPGNFPDLRLAQLAMIIHRNQALLFRKMINAPMPGSATLCDFLNVRPPSYWDTHYRLNKPTGSKPKPLGQDTLNIIMINTLAPMLFLYAKENQKPALLEALFSMMETLLPENNNITRQWSRVLREPVNAAESQGMIELRKHYCVPKKCLTCMLGHQIIGKQPFKSP